ncbi:MAG TPA: SCO family protein [Actinomycetes bacterium]
MPTLCRPAVGAAVAALVAALPLCACSAPAPMAANPGGAVVATQGASSAGFHGVVLDEPYQEPTASFTDMQGQPFTFARDAKRPVVLVFFGYTSCPDVCSTVLADVASALRPLDPGTRKLVELLFITTDPARDTGSVMRAYLARFDPTFVGLTAPMPEIQQVATGLGVAITGPDASGSSYTVGHGAQVIGFGPNQTAGVIWLPGTPVRDLRADVVRLASEA